MTSLLNYYTGADGREPVAWERLSPLPEKQFGLEVYAAINIDPKSGKPWREVYSNPEDVFIRRDAEGKVQTFISCSNLNVPQPPCTHDFNFPNHMKIRVYLSYNRHLLSDWQKYEENAIQLINSFRVKHKQDSIANKKGAKP